MTTIILSVALLAALLTPGVAAALPACSAPAAEGSEWPMYGHDYANSRHQSATSIGPAEAARLAPAWTFSSKQAGGDGDFTGTPVVAGGCLFVGSNTGWVFAADAETGEPVWTTQLTEGGTINSSLAVSDGRVYAFVSRVNSPYVAAFDASDGTPLWTTTVDEQEGADAFASPVVFDGLVIVGISGDAAQHGDEGQREGFHGSFVILDTDGRLLRKTWTVPPDVWRDGFGGATVTTTAAIDPVRKIAFLGTGSAFLPQYEHDANNALLRVDLDRSSPTFGEIVASWKGDTFDAVVPGYSTLPCEDLPIPPPPAIVPTGRGLGACGDVDVDFAASPNLFPGPDGRLMVGDSQKSGAFHALDAETMTHAWTTRFAPAQPFGGSSASFDGDSLYVAAAPPGQMYGIGKDAGDVRWVSPIADGPHYGLAVASAGGVVYTVDVKGFLDAYDARTGVPVLMRPIKVGSDTGTDPAVTFGGVAVARDTVYAAVGAQSTGIDFMNVLTGYVVAYRPA